MEDRGFSEVELRIMIQEATGLRPSVEAGRWIATVIHDSESWEIVVEPDRQHHLIVVVTAYPVEEP